MKNIRSVCNDETETLIISDQSNSSALYLFFLISCITAFFSQYGFWKKYWNALLLRCTGQIILVPHSVSCKVVK